MKKKATNSSGSKPGREKLLVSRQEAMERLDTQIEKGREIEVREIDNPAALKILREEYYRWDTFNGNLLKALFSTDERCNQYHFGIGGGGTFRSLQDEIDSLRSDIGYAVRKLQYVADAIDLIEVDDAVQGNDFVCKKAVTSNRVFVVHGHDDAAKLEAARLLTRLRLVPIILSEQENQGRTIIEKFEHYADVGFAVVLLTPDDLGSTVIAFDKDGACALVKRARQNVVFEMGFFYGHLRRSKVCALLKPGTERPSDIDGIIYTEMDPAGAWKLELAKEMKAAGLPIDLNDLHG